VWRADEGYEREGDLFMKDLTEAPSEYYKRQVWVSVEPDEGPARYTIEEFGCDNLVFSTDSRSARFSGTTALASTRLGSQPRFPAEPRGLTYARGAIPSEGVPDLSRKPSGSAL
jgi:hypothetical protein